MHAAPMKIRYVMDDDGVPDRPELSHCCQKPIATGFGEPRCVKCGHRQPIGAVPPKQTRFKAPWRWPGELIDRYRVKHNPVDGPDYTLSPWVWRIVLIGLGMAIYACIMATVAFFIT